MATHQVSGEVLILYVLWNFCYNKQALPVPLALMQSDLPLR